MVDEIIARFVKKQKRERLSFLAKKRWDDFRDALLHDTRNLEPSVMTRLADSVTVDELARLLKDARAFCISDILELDGRELVTREALGAAFGRMRDTLVFCAAAGRAYYENHEGERYLLQ